MVSRYSLLLSAPPLSQARVTTTSNDAPANMVMVSGPEFAEMPYDRLAESSSRLQMTETSSAARVELQGQTPAERKPASSLFFAALSNSKFRLDFFCNNRNIDCVNVSI